jgi:hypothetical protein
MQEALTEIAQKNIKKLYPFFVHFRQTAASYPVCREIYFVKRKRRKVFLAPDFSNNPHIQQKEEQAYAHSSFEKQ